MQTSKIKYLGDLRTEAIHLQSSNSVTTDAPVDNEGKGEFFSPTDLLATALGSCMLTIMGITAKAHDLNITGATVNITKVMGINPRRVIEVVVEINLPHNNFTDREKKLIEASAYECPVAKSLNTDLKQTISFNYKKD